MPTEPRPKANEITSFASRLERVWSESHQVMRDIDRYYWREFPVWNNQEAIEDRPSFRPSKPANIVDHAADNQLSFQPKVHRPHDEGLTASKRAGTIENWLKAAFEESMLLEVLNPFKAAGKYLLLYGYSPMFAPRLDMAYKVKKPKRGSDDDDDSYDSRLRIYEAERAQWNPIRISTPHPSTVLMDPTEKQPHQAIVKATRYKIELERLSQEKARTRRYADVWTGPGNKSAYDEIEATEYWSDQWHAVLVGDRPIYVERNTWGFLPFVHAFAGYGQERLDGRGNPRYQSIGLLHHIRDSLRMQAQEINSKHNLIQRNAWTPMGTNQDPTEFARALATGSVLEGNVDDYWVLRQPPVDRPMFEWGIELGADIEEGTYARPIRGDRQTGVDTVGQQAILTGAAAKKFLSPQKQMEHLVSVIGSRMLRLVATVTGPITIRGIRLTPDDIGNDFSVIVTFSQVDPVLALQEREIGMREHSSRLISASTYRANYARLEDEDGERKRLARERLMEHPAIIEAEARIAAEEEGVADIIREYEEGIANAADEQAARRTNGAQRGQGGLPPRQPLTDQTAKPGPINPAAFINK